MDKSERMGIMIQGTGSGAGKSLMTAALGRYYHRSGLRVRPFKPQNMSNNAAVCDGGEIARAQAMQAMACGTEATIDMNPLLLKPQGGSAQIIVGGRVHGRASARQWRRMAADFLPEILKAYHRLAEQADLMLVEGAGSPAEVNLAGPDIANMAFAEQAGLPVILIADIERGGALAAIIGTWHVLSKAHRQRLKGYIINKFRGDLSLLEPAFAIIRDHCGLECLGVMPWCEQAAMVPGEDSLDLADMDKKKGEKVDMAADRCAVRIVIPRLPHIANFDDFDPLRQDGTVDLILARPGYRLPGADLIILPGSKAVIADLDFLRDQKWDVDINDHVRRGGKVLGICAGYQMLGQSIDDPQGIEGKACRRAGLGFLDVATILANRKILRFSHGRHVATGVPIHGYEMHLGVTSGADCRHPCLMAEDKADRVAQKSGTGGAPSCAGARAGGVEGLYLHGIFADDVFRQAYLCALRPGAGEDFSYRQRVEAAFDALADQCGESLDTKAIQDIARMRID